MRNEAIFFLAVGGCVYALATTEVPDKAPVEAVASYPPVMAMARQDDSVREREPGFSGDETIIARDASGQFHLAAQVDGQDAEFLVDTGADMVALSTDEASRLGFNVDPSSFRPLTQTAAGIGQGAVIHLASLEVAGQTFRNIDALVLDGLPVNLLGQSVLGRLGQVSLEGNRMVIRR